MCLTLHKQKGGPGLLHLDVPSINLTQCSKHPVVADEGQAASWGWEGKRQTRGKGQCTISGAVAASADRRLLQMTILTYSCLLV